MNHNSKHSEERRTIRIKVVYQRYERYQETPISEGHITAPDLRTAILALLDRIGMYADSEEILALEEENGKKWTAEELINKFISQVNGDGCDFVFNITNEETGEIIFNSNYDYEPVSWDIIVDTAR